MIVSPSIAMASIVPMSGSMVTTAPPVKIRSTGSGSDSVVVEAGSDVVVTVVVVVVAEAVADVVG
ncbi:hypothetical protein BMS3Abin02_01188 [bacterium BMS3Abin02]|nr:hypothetical protein BMS3Abin02_01188 [bacterium BMS3Abin02]